MFKKKKNQQSKLKKKYRNIEIINLKLICKRLENNLYDKFRKASIYQLSHIRVY